MQLKNKVCVVTGAAGGIGAALARHFAAKGAKGIVVADIQNGPARSVADEVGGKAFIGDMTQETDIQELIAMAEET